jgi:peptidoglycan/LPS O-acetylase OafA/YrhL
MTSPTSRHRFTSLDGLRGVAALVVVAWHAGATRLIPGGYLAVDLFFVLSGFVLSYAFEGWQRWGVFMAARLKRLYPLYIGGIVIGALETLLHVAADSRYWTTLGVSVFMAPAPVTWGGVYRPYPFDLPAWSLFFELLVNAVWFALTPRLSSRMLAMVIGISGVGVAATIAMKHSIAVGDAGADFLWFGFVRATFSFFVGVACYRLWKRRPAPIKPPVWALAIVFLIPVVMPMPRPVADAAAVFVIFPAVIYLGAGAAPRGWLARACDEAGRASYAVYTLHAPLLAMAGWALRRAAPSLPHADYMLAAAAVPLMLLIGMAADRFYDGPLRLRLSRPARGLRPRLLRPAASGPTRQTDRRDRPRSSIPT